MRAHTAQGHSGGGTVRGGNPVAHQRMGCLTHFLQAHDSQAQSQSPRATDADNRWNSYAHSLLLFAAYVCVARAEIGTNNGP